MMVTSYGDPERRRCAGELGATEFHTKAVDFDLRKERLRQLLPAARVTQRGSGTTNWRLLVFDVCANSAFWSP